MEVQSEGVRPSLCQAGSAAYVVPFVSFLVLLASADYLAFLGAWDYPFRVIVLAVILFACSRHVIDFRIRRFARTVLLGVGVFAVWIAPDVLFPGYRSHWLFDNPITGQLTSSLESSFRVDPMVLGFRSVCACLDLRHATGDVARG